MINKTTPIADLRWSIAHVPFIDLATINRLKAIGAGVAVHALRYLSERRIPRRLVRRTAHDHR